MSDTGGVAAVPVAHPLGRRAAAALQPVRAADWLTAALSYLCIALATRWFLIGNPVIHIDEQFYLFVAERMRDGALPYVDIWDRKPVGLFLVYAAFAALPGDPVVGYQIGALGAMVATAMVIARLAREIASPAAAWQAGVAYLLFMPAFNSGMGQAPTFYNLPVALAALAVVETVKLPEDRLLIGRGAAIMLLLGLAIQIKYTVLFEGLAFGILLLSRGFGDVWPWRRLFGVALLWMGIALLPTLAVGAWYLHAGHFAAFFDANFVSIFKRGSDGWQAPWRLVKEVAVLTPFWLALFHGASLPGADPGRHPKSHLVLKVWGLAACTGFLLFGTWYDHYVAPLLVPLCVLAAPALARTGPGQKIWGRLLLGFGAIAGLAVSLYQVKQHGDARQYGLMQAQIQREMHGGCLYIYEGELAFYRTVNACLPTSRIFPNHLNTTIEAAAVGVDPTAEVRRIMASRPDVVVMRAPGQNMHLPNLATRRSVEAALRHDYIRYAEARLGNKRYWLYRPR